ncbi:hypothetical protein M1M18_gp100 [Halorubrum virus Serpecor1]|uniref:Uncharacterized protein n=1 Tax=Halorubrum virus Serpecor1 TaxID=2721757 RepID=A0A6G9RXX2_9CAUD|nr:hypothetical protein M1M18_gp100 [Halorubrum virus Serpecor1]QIR31200.1 hypothetical protein HrrSp1_175 [Halorubrum virus Serpecor1]
MARVKYVLHVPPGYDGPVDPIVDEVEVDESVTKPGVEEVAVAEAGEGVLDRNLVNNNRKAQVSEAIQQYELESDKAEPDVQVQLDALEKAVSYMWDVVSGEDIGSEALREAELDAAEADGGEDDSTSA